MKTTVFERNFGGPLTLEVDLIPTLYSFGQGGPVKATFTASGEMPAIWRLFDLLRCPMTIESERGDLRWWGYMSQVTATVEAIEFGATLDSMSNRVAVAYSYVAPGTSDVGQRRTTAWSEDTNSSGVYGKKEALISLAGATDAAALQVRDLILSERKYPLATWQRVPGQRTRSVTAAIEARGWWSTLEWRNYKINTTSSVETTTQIKNAIEAYGQFFAGVTIETASGLATSEYRAGDTTLLSEVEALLKAGTTAGDLLWAWTDAQRLVRVQREPRSGESDYQMRYDGEVFDPYGRRIDQEECPTGIWLSLAQAMTGIDEGHLLSFTKIFVESAEYDVATNQYRPQARGVPGPFDLVSRLT